MPRFCELIINLNETSIGCKKNIISGYEIKLFLNRFTRLLWITNHACTLRSSAGRTTKQFFHERANLTVVGEDEPSIIK